MTVRLFILLVLFVVCGTARLKAETAERMASACKTVDEASVIDDDHIALTLTFDTGVCWGAFSALQMAFNAVDTAHSNTPVFYVCSAGKGSSRSQWIKIFLAYTKRHPERLNEDFFYVARDALKEVFPCNK